MDIPKLQKITDDFLLMPDGQWNGPEFNKLLKEQGIPFQEWRSQIEEELARIPSKLTYKDPELSIILTRIPRLKNNPDILKKLSPNALQKLGVQASIESRYPALVRAASQTFD